MGLNIEDLDIVYCVKNKPVNEELRYSLRSLKNIPHKDVFIFGGCPSWVDTSKVKWVEVPQKKGNKWLNTSVLLSEIVNNPDVTENFIWFNDDFFVLKKIEELPYYYDRTLVARVLDFSKISWRTMQNGYCSRLKSATRRLRYSEKPILNYELHLPIIFNKTKLMEIMEKYPGIGAKRSLYCNNFVEDAIRRNDVKIYKYDEVPDETWDFVSTSDLSFSVGEVGKYIRKKFKGKSKYEKGKNDG